MMFSRAARRAGGSEPSRLIANAPTVTRAHGTRPEANGEVHHVRADEAVQPLVRQAEQQSADATDYTDGSRLGQDHAHGEPPTGSHCPQYTDFTTPLEHRERQRLKSATAATNTTMIHTALAMNML